MWTFQHWTVHTASTKTVFFWAFGEHSLIILRLPRFHHVRASPWHNNRNPVDWDGQWTRLASTKRHATRREQRAEVDEVNYRWLESDVWQFSVLSCGSFRKLHLVFWCSIEKHYRWTMIKPPPAKSPLLARFQSPAHLDRALAMTYKPMTWCVFRVVSPR